MSFHLMAIFAKADKALMKEASKRWPEAKCKAIEGPFKGMAIASPYINKADTEEEYEKANDVGYDLEENLPEFSKQYPETVFVFVEVDCTGGTCLYKGYVCKNGETIAKEKGKGALKPLINHLGIELNGEQFFEPFKRGFFE